MQSKVGSFAIKDIVFMDMESSVFHLIEEFSSLHFSALPVLDRSGRCFGIVSPADVFDFISSGGDVNAVKAWEICSHTMIYVHPDITITQACEVMRDNGIHHLIVGDAEKPIGIISTMDIIQKVREEGMAAVTSTHKNTAEGQNT